MTPFETRRLRHPARLAAKRAASIPDGALRTLAAAAVILAGAVPAAADFEKVTDRQRFLGLVENKVLSRPFIELRVTPQGEIAGRGMQWDVSGDWSWQEGYFCRDLYWGGDPLGYNCQEVSADGDRIRFTSDRGSGRSADFRLQ